ncbi:MAG: BatA domain-containing protein, partial [Bacteroidetes bacterium]|nr:BatA domain-containing protein [Bacteroidota bacterium]
MFEFFNDITFANKELRWLFLVIPFVIVWYIFKNKTMNAEFKISSFAGFEKLKPSFKQYLRHLLIIIRIAVLSLLILVLMRPQSRSSFKN